VTDDGYDLDNLAVDAAQLIERMGNPPCHFVGFSMGGMVALRLAIRRPELLRSMVLMNTSADLEDNKDLRQAKMLRFFTRWLGPRVTVGRVMPFFFSDDFTEDPERQVEVEEWRGHFLANDRVGVSRAVLGVLERQGVADELDKIQTPTLIICGEKDVATTPEKSQKMHAAIKGSQLVTIPRSGHMTPVQEPEAVNAALEAFYRSQIPDP
jgi:3-oxoadipate enol-lactonase